MNQRVEYIDTLKGIAIILVVMGHVVQFIWGDRFGSDQILFVIIYSFHMPLFFFLSGICTRTDAKGILLQKKIQTLLYPFLLWNFIVYMQHLQVPSGSIIRIRHAGYWFLICLFYMNCFSKLAQIVEFRINKKKRMVYDVILYGIIYTIVLLVCKMTDGSELNELLCLQFIPFNMPFFILGYFIKKYGSLNEILSSERTGFYAFVTYICLMYLWIFYSDKIPHKLFPSILIAFTAIIAIYSLFKDKILSNKYKFINKIGKRSLEIYLLHPLMFVGLGLLSDILADYKYNLLLVLSVMSFFSIVCISYCMIIAELLWRNKYVALFLFGRRSK